MISSRRPLPFRRHAIPDRQKVIGLELSSVDLVPEQQFGSVPRASFSKQDDEVKFNCALGNPELLSDLSVAEAEIYPC